MDNKSNAVSATGSPGDNANITEQKFSQHRGSRSILTTKTQERGQRNADATPRSREVDLSNIYAHPERSVRFENTENRSTSQNKKAGEPVSTQKPEKDTVAGSPGSQQGKRGYVPMNETVDSYTDLIHGTHDDEKKNGGLQFSNRIRSLGRQHPIEPNDALPSIFNPKQSTPSNSTKKRQPRLQNSLSVPEDKSEKEMSNQRNNIIVKDQMVDFKSTLFANKNKKLGISVIPKSVLDMSNGNDNGATTPMTGMPITFNKTLDCQNQMNGLTKTYNQPDLSRKSSNLSRTQFDARQSKHYPNDTISDLQVNNFILQISQAIDSDDGHVQAAGRQSHETLAKLQQRAQRIGSPPRGVPVHHAQKRLSTSKRASTIKRSSANRKATAVSPNNSEVPGDDSRYNEPQNKKSKRKNGSGAGTGRGTGAETPSKSNLLSGHLKRSSKKQPDRHTVQDLRKEIISEACGKLNKRGFEREHRDNIEKLIQKYVSSWNSTVRSEAQLPLQTQQSNVDRLNQRVPSHKGIKSLRPSRKSFEKLEKRPLESAAKRAQDLYYRVTSRITERDSSQFSSIAQEQFKNRIGDLESKQLLKQKELSQFLKSSLEELELHQDNFEACAADFGDTPINRPRSPQKRGYDMPQLKFPAFVNTDEDISEHNSLVKTSARAGHVDQLRFEKSTGRQVTRFGRQIKGDGSNPNQSPPSTQKIVTLEGMTAEKKLAHSKRQSRRRRSEEPRSAGSRRRNSSRMEEIEHSQSEDVASALSTDSMDGVFNDTLQQFVDLMKIITQASQIRIFSKELVQIFEDIRSKRVFELDQDQRQSIHSKLEEFAQEIKDKDNRSQDEEASSSDGSRQGDKDADTVYRYKAPRQTFFRLFESAEQAPPSRKGNEGETTKKSTSRKFIDARPSGVRGFNLMLLKVTLSRTGAPIELEEWDGDADNYDSNAEAQYLIISVLFREYSPDYFPEMFMNVCQNFLFADETLRADLNILLGITKQMAGNQRVMELNLQQQSLESSPNAHRIERSAVDGIDSLIQPSAPKNLQLTTLNQALKQGASSPTERVEKRTGRSFRNCDDDCPPQKTEIQEVHFNSADRDFNEEEEVINEELQSATETERFKQVPNTIVNREGTAADQQPQTTRLVYFGEGNDSITCQDQQLLSSRRANPTADPFSNSKVGKTKKQDGGMPTATSNTVGRRQPSPPKLSMMDRSESPVADPDMDGSGSRGRLSLHRVEVASGMASQNWRIGDDADGARQSTMKNDRIRLSMSPPPANNGTEKEFLPSVDSKMKSNQDFQMISSPSYSDRQRFMKQNNAENGSQIIKQKLKARTYGSKTYPKTTKASPRAPQITSEVPGGVSFSPEKSQKEDTSNAMSAKTSPELAASNSEKTQQTGGSSHNKFLKKLIANQNYGPKGRRTHVQRQQQTQPINHAKNEHRRHSNQVQINNQSSLNSTINLALHKPIPDDSTSSILKLSLDSKPQLFGGKLTTRGVLTRRTANQINSSLDNALFPQNSSNLKQAAAQSKVETKNSHLKKSEAKQKSQHRQSTSYADLHSTSIGHHSKNESYTDKQKRYRNSASTNHGSTTYLQSASVSSQKKNRTLIQ